MKAVEAPDTRIACVVVPNFAIEVCLRDHPHLLGTPLALAEAELESSEVIAINDQAATAGLMLKLTVAQAHIVCPDLTVKVNDPEREIEQSNIIYKKLQSLSPFVEEARPGLYFLDASGLQLLYKSEQQFIETLIMSIRSNRPDPYDLRVGMAQNKFVARVAADRAARNSFSLVSPGRVKALLRPLPIEQLQTDITFLPSELIDGLHSLGLTTIGQVAAFPANEMIRRFGPAGAALSQLSRGNDTSFFAPDVPSEPLTETTWLTEPIYRTEMILAHVEQLLSELLPTLSRYSQGCSALEITFFLDNRSEQLVSVTTERPTLSVRIFLRQLQTILEQQKLPASINGLKVTIPAVAALLAEQLPLGDTIASGHTAPENRPDSPLVVTPVRHDLFLPEQRFTFTTPAKLSPPDRNYLPPVWSEHCAYANSTIGGLRLFQPFRKIEVTVNKQRPVAINQPGRRLVTITSRGPWELSGDWWHRAYSRLYWEVRTVDHQRFLIFNDRLAERWFVQGVFD